MYFSLLLTCVDVLDFVLCCPCDTVVQKQIIVLKSESTFHNLLDSNPRIFQKLKSQ